jgi:rare lipoprotein A
MVISHKKQYLLNSITLIRATVLLAVVLVLLAISTVAVRAAESSLRTAAVKPTPTTTSTVNSAAAVPVQTVAPAAAAGATTVAKKAHAINMMFGNASWYGSVLQGHKTASGELFDEHLLTAAHRTLPFGTMVEVTDLRNHLSVIVKITDRGELYADRAIDLSYAAADKLHMVHDGVHPVKLTVIPKNDPILAGWTEDAAASADATMDKN